MKPTATSLSNTNRIQELDLLRGFALLGILCINVQIFSYSISIEAEWAQTFSDFWNKLVIETSFVMAAQRFIGLFSILFGLGIAIQKQTYEALEKPYLPHFLKRTLVLGLFGIINFSLFFWGDVLFIYSLLSLLLLVCFRLSNRLLIALAVLVFVLPRLLLLNHSIEMFLSPPRLFISEHYPASTLINTYQQGSVIEMMKLRIAEYIAFNLTEFAWIRTAFAMMIVGYLIGRNNWHKTYVNHLNNIKLAFFALAPLSVVYIIYNLNQFIFFIPMPRYIVLSDLFIATSLFVYIVVVLWLFSFPPLQKLKTVMSNLGRLSLSNYFLQQILCAFIFHNYGLGLYFKTTPIQNLGIIMLIYCLQLWLTDLYLKKYKMGPLETIWRKLSN